MSVIISTINGFLNMIELVIYKAINILANINFFSLNLIEIILIFTIFCNIALFILYMVGDRT